MDPVLVLNFGLVKDSFPPRTVKVKPCGFLAKTFFFQLNFLAVKNFLPETLTLPGQPAKWPFAPRLLICCLSQSLSHPLNFTCSKINILPLYNLKPFIYATFKICPLLSLNPVLHLSGSTRLEFLIVKP
jgi:hypothetical protein